MIFLQVKISDRDLMNEGIQKRLDARIERQGNGDVVCKYDGMRRYEDDGWSAAWCLGAAWMLRGCCVVRRCCVDAACVMRGCCVGAEWLLRACYCVLDVWC